MLRFEIVRKVAWYVVEVCAFVFGFAHNGRGLSNFTHTNDLVRT